MLKHESSGTKPHTHESLANNVKYNIDTLKTLKRTLYKMTCVYTPLYKATDRQTW